jgi:DNA-binding beta-propeller fold protein YncE
MTGRQVSKWLRLGVPVAGLAVVVALGVHAAPQGQEYKVVKRMPVGGDGRWDYLRVDAEAHRIYVTRGSHLMVVDENSGKVIGDVPAGGAMNMHGVALAHDLGKGFTSNGDTNSLTVFDLKTLKSISEIKIDAMNPDSILYDPGTKRIFTFNGRTMNATAIDASTGTVAGTVALAGKPEEPALDGKGNIFVNIEDKNSIQEFDAKTLAVKATWPIAPCEGPSALAYDPAHNRLFAACEKMIVVVNAETGTVVASPPIGGDPDGNGFDPATGLIFASCREGIVSIIHQDSADKYSVVGNVTTQFGARTMTLDPKTHHVFTETADFKPAPAPTPDNPRPRPEPIAGSFVILELAR